MNQLYFVGPGHVEWDETSSPELHGDSDALVRPLAVATCDLDTALIHGVTPFSGPFPLGHEGVGRVTAIGRDVKRIELGQLVLIPFQISCGSCARCIVGRTGSCERVNFGAMYGLEPFGGPWGGFLSDLVRVPWADHMLVPVPEDIDQVSIASLSDNIPDGWRTIAPYITHASEDSVLIIGGAAPSIPFFSIVVAKALGVTTVDYLSIPSDANEQKASRLGARPVPTPEDVPAGAYALTVCSSNELEALYTAIRATQPDGTCVINTIFFQEDVTLPLFSMYTQGIRLVTGRVNARSAIPSVLELIVRGLLEPTAVIDAVVDWSDAADALVSEPRKLVIRR